MARYKPWEVCGRFIRNRFRFMCVCSRGGPQPRARRSMHPANVPGQPVAAGPGVIIDEEDGVDCDNWVRHHGTRQRHGEHRNPQPRGWRARNTHCRAPFPWRNETKAIPKPGRSSREEPRNPDIPLPRQIQAPASRHRVITSKKPSVTGVYDARGQILRAGARFFQLCAVRGRLGIARRHPTSEDGDPNRACTLQSIALVPDVEINTDDHCANNDVHAAGDDDGSDRGCLR